MEEKKENNINTNTQPEQTKNVSDQLNKINKIEQSIADMQAHIKFLLKRQNDEERKLNKLYDLSIKKAATKISTASDAAKSLEHKQKKLEERSNKNNQIKQLRQKEMNMLRQTRLQIHKVKQIQRVELKQLSKRNSDKIKKMKEQQASVNKDKAIKIKNSHREFTQQKRKQKQIQKKQKQEQLMKRSIIRLNEKQTMQMKMQKLKQMQQKITARLQKNKEIQQKLQQTTRKISEMKLEDIIGKAKTVRGQSASPRQALQLKNSQHIQRYLLKSAVRKIQQKQKESVLLYR